MKDCSSGMCGACPSCLRRMGVPETVVNSLRAGVELTGRPNRTSPIDEIDMGLIRKFNNPEEVIKHG